MLYWSDHDRPEVNHQGVCHAQAPPNTKGPRLPPLPAIRRSNPENDEQFQGGPFSSTTGVRGRSFRRRALRRGNGRRSAPSPRGPGQALGSADDKQADLPRSREYRCHGCPVSARRRGRTLRSHPLGRIHLMVRSRYLSFFFSRPQTRTLSGPGPPGPSWNDRGRSPTRGLGLSPCSRLPQAPVRTNRPRPGPQFQGQRARAEKGARKMAPGRRTGKDGQSIRFRPKLRRRVGSGICPSSCLKQVGYPLLGSLNTNPQVALGSTCNSPGALTASGISPVLF